MEWWLTLLLILGGFIFLMLTGLPVALCFMLINIIGIIFLMGFKGGFPQLILSMFESVSTFSLLPVPLFVLMGEVMFQSGVAPRMLDTLDKWLGRLPGRLGLLAVGGGTLLSTLTGTSLASTAVLGSVLVPEMEKRGYKKSMSIGPILGSGGLAIMIPPTSLGVLLGAIAQISIGKLLIAIIIPGLLMAVLYAGYIVGRCRLQPSIAPSYSVSLPPISERIMAAVKYILPLGFIIFLVVGVIFIGVATPSEAAATGALGCFILAACHGKLNWLVAKKSIEGTLQVTVMMFLVIAGARAFAQILAFSGATRELIEVTVALPLAPIMIIIAMQVVVLFMGMFMSVVAIMMITLPMFMSVVQAFGFDPVWFAVIFLLNVEMATTTPPYGLSLYVMKGVAPADTTMGDVFRAALPFLCCDAIAMALMLAFPAISQWLPSLMRG